MEQKKVKLSIGIGFFVILLLAAWSYQRNSLWADPMEFYLNEIRLAPQKSRPYVNLAMAYMNKGDMERAGEAMRHALQYSPELKFRFEEWQRDQWDYKFYCIEDKNVNGKIPLE